MMCVKCGHRYNKGHVWTIGVSSVDWVLGVQTQGCQASTASAFPC